MPELGTAVEKSYKDVEIENATEIDIDSHMAQGQVIEGEIFPGINKKTILAFLAICTQLSAYEMTLLVPASAISYINADLGPSPNYPWINVTWSLGAAILVSVAGRLSDIFGRRYFMLCGASISFVGTIVGATGQNIPQMILSGILFGIGSGFQELGFACIMEFIPNRYRLTALGLYGTSALPCIFSPLITYSFIAHTAIGWRGAYWLMCGWHAFGIMCLLLFYHPPTFTTKHEEEHVSKWKLIRELDYVGLFLFVAGCTLFLVGLNFGGRQYPWKSATVIAPIVVGFLLFVALFVWDFNMTLKYPLLPPKLFRQWRGYNVLVIVGFCLGMLYYSMQVLWPRQSGAIFAAADQPIMRGVYANLTIWGTWLSLISIWLVCAKIGYEKRQILFFVCCQIIFIGCLSSVKVSEKSKAIALVFLMSCVINQPLYMLFEMVSLNLEDQADIGVAVGALSTFRLLGGAVATAIYGSIVTNQFEDVLPRKVEQALVGLDLNSKSLIAIIKAAFVNTPAAYAKVPGITEQAITASQFAVKLAYTQAFKIVYYTALGFAVLAIVSALLVRDVDPAKMTLDKAVFLENEKPKTTSTDKGGAGWEDDVHSTKEV